MPLDAKKYPMLSDVSRWPHCRECEGRMVRVETAGVGQWMCLDWDCGAEIETDAQLDNRMTSDAESSFERQQSSAMGGGSFLSPDAMQRGLKR